MGYETWQSKLLPRKRFKRPTSQDFSGVGQLLQTSARVGTVLEKLAEYGGNPLSKGLFTRTTKFCHAMSCDR
jgi:hypothetical protein